MSDETFMRRAIELSATALTIPGALPYGAVVVDNDRIAGEGLNRTLAACDPTSHAEIEAIRAACKSLSTVSLPGFDMYTSCEPCSMCAATMYMTGIRRVYFATTIADSKAMFEALAERDPKWQRRYDPVDVQVNIAKPIDARTMPAVQLLQSEGLGVFDAFLEANS